MGLNPITVDYTITFRNTGTMPLTLTQVRDLLPPGFVYSPGTTWGLTSDEPSPTVFQGRQRLDWVFDPGLTIASGSTKEVNFKVQGPFLGGHWNDAWLTFNEFANTQYTWPSAGITVIGTTEVDTTTNGVTIHSLTWEIDPGSFVVWEWQITS